MAVLVLCEKGWNRAGRVKRRKGGPRTDGDVRRREMATEGWEEERPWERGWGDDRELQLESTGETSAGPNGMKRCLHQPTLHTG